MSTPAEKPLPRRLHRFDFDDDQDPSAIVKPLAGKASRKAREPQHVRQQSYETPEAKARRLERQNAEQRIIISDLQSQVQELQTQVDQLRDDWEKDLQQALLRRSQSINNQITAQDSALTEMMKSINSAFEAYQIAFQNSRRGSDESVEEIRIYRDSGNSSMSGSSF